MLKNLPPGFMALDNDVVFQARNLFFVSQEDDEKTSTVSIDNAVFDANIKADISPADILKKANDACGEILDIVKIYSNRTGKEGEGKTFYLNRKAISELLVASSTQNEETIAHTKILPKTANALATIHLPMQKVLDILSATPY